MSEVDLSKATKTEIGSEEATNASKEKMTNIVDDIVNDIAGVQDAEKNADVATQSDEIDRKDKSDEKKDEAEQDKSEDAEEAESTETEDKNEDEEEELIPKSKVQDRIDSLTAKVKALEAEKAKLAQKAPEQKSQNEKLDALSIDELKQLRKDTRRAIRTESDEAKLSQLEDLEDKVEEKMSTFSQRFQQRQASNLQEILPELAKIDPKIAQLKGDLWNMATRIYAKSKAMQGHEMGQVEAAILAAEYYANQSSKIKAGESQADLSRQVQTLKKKTSLEGKTHVAQQKATSNQKLLDRAKKGSSLDKELFFEQALVPDFYLDINN